MNTHEKMAEMPQILLSLAVRVLIALCTRTFFQPDEYFQSLEPAYRIVFGYGHLTWEWLSPAPIRSIIYPALNIPIYWLLKTSGLRNHAAWGDALLIAAPKLLHGTLAAITDIWLCKLTRKVLGERYVSTALFISLTSAFHALSLSRSMSNSLETSLSTIAYFHYPWDIRLLNPAGSYSLRTKKDVTGKFIHISSIRYQMRKTLCFAALACAIRPTNAVIWVYLFSNILWSSRSYPQLRLQLLSDAFCLGIIAMSALFVLDTLYYQKPTFTALNFLRTNLSSVSLFYGMNSWHYYITQAIPILCGMSLPFALHGSWTILHTKSHRRLHTMLGLVVWTTSVYSFAGHKEWRFLHPMLPLLHVIAAKSLVDLGLRGNDNPTRTSLPIRKSHLAFLLLSIPVCAFVVAIYCSAPISVIPYLRELPHEELRNGGVGFLMPCHSTPWQAYLHREDAKIWALGCEPPLANQNLTEYKDQTNVFYQSPTKYMARYFPAKVDPSFPPSPYPSTIPGDLASVVEWKHEWPRRLVLFGALLQEAGVREYLSDRGYAEVWRKGWDWEGEGTRTGGVRVWRFDA